MSDTRELSHFYTATAITPLHPPWFCRVVSAMSNFLQNVSADVNILKQVATLMVALGRIATCTR